jgi:hypothetical protein
MVMRVVAKVLAGATIYLLVAFAMAGSSGGQIENGLGALAIVPALASGALLWSLAMGVPRGPNLDVVPLIPGKWRALPAAVRSAIAAVAIFLTLAPSLAILTSLQLWNESRLGAVGFTTLFGFWYGLVGCLAALGVRAVGEGTWWVLKRAAEWDHRRLGSE